MQMGFYYDQTLCTHCAACVVACKDWHDVPAGPVSYVRIAVIERGVYPDVAVSQVIRTCYHCANPACVSGCPAEAVIKRPQDGIVLVNSDKCIGRGSCGVCKEQCPYGAPQFGTEQGAKMQKCDFCLERLAEGKEPICVGACPMKALDAGPIEELKAKYGEVMEADGFVFVEKLSPSIVFNPMIDNQHLAVRKTWIIPSAEG